MKKTTLKRTIAAIMLAATVATTGTAMSVSASAQEATTKTESTFHMMAPASAYEKKGIFNKAYDPAAPDVNKEAFEKGVYKQSEVNMYNIKAGKYYVLRIHRTKVNSFGYTRTNYEHHLVKVERAFEDPKWYGSERTIDVRYCDSGETQRICPGKFFAVNYPIFEIDNFICK